MCGFLNGDDDIACEDGGTCDGNGLCTDKADGADCAQHIECLSGHCVSGECGSGVLWVRTFGNIGPNSGQAIATNEDDRVVVAGAAGTDEVALGFAEDDDEEVGTTFFVTLDSFGIVVDYARVGSDFTQIQGVAATADSVILAGRYDEELTIPSLPPLPSHDERSPFVASLPAFDRGGDGWLTGFDPQSGTFSEVGKTVPALLGDSIIVAGVFQGEGFLPQGPGGGLDAMGADDVFVARVAGDGESVVWSTSFGSDEAERVGSVTTDGIDSVYVGVGPGGPLTIPGCDSPAESPIVVKLDGNGDCLWAEGDANGSVSDSCVAGAPGGGVVVGGTFEGTLNLGGEERQVFNDTGFVAKLTAGGDTEWIHFLKSLPGEDPEINIRAIAVDGAGDVVITGDYRGRVELPGSGVLESVGGADAFFVKLSGVDGHHLWSKSLGSPSGTGVGLGVACDTGNNVLVTGAFSETVEDFAGSTHDLVSSGALDVFVIKLSP